MSYVTKKIARYMNWLQHDTRIFNVGERRRVVAGVPDRSAHTEPVMGMRSLGDSTSPTMASVNSILNHVNRVPLPAAAAEILVNDRAIRPDGLHMLPPAALDPPDDPKSDAIANPEPMEQNAHFFDPENSKAAQIRDQVALETLEDLLDYVLDQGGSVGIFDATNSTLERRKLIMKRVRERAGPELGVLFLESVCQDQNVSLGLRSTRILRCSSPCPEYRPLRLTAAL
jgi:6-phosphofructo-2-kinase